MTDLRIGERYRWNDLAFPNDPPWIVVLWQLGATDAYIELEGSPGFTEWVPRNELEPLDDRHA